MYFPRPRARAGPLENSLRHLAAHVVEVQQRSALDQAASGDYHGFPQSADAFSGDGTVTPIVGGDGVTRWQLTILGSYNGRTGVFEYIRNPDGAINHRLFVPSK